MKTDSNKCTSQLLRKVSLVTMAFVLFIIGGYIYVVFRPMSLRMFSWFESIEIMDVIDMLRLNPILKTDSSFIIYSLPNGLWATSYILIMDALWAPSIKMQILFATIIPIIGILSELLQSAGILKGTFDTKDLLCYAIPCIGYVLLKPKIK